MEHPAVTVDKAASARIDALDYVRGIAIVHIIFYHYLIEWFKGKSFWIGTDGVAANWSRIMLFGDGSLAAVKNIFAVMFAYGYASVNVFLILSGFVLTYRALEVGECMDWAGVWMFFVKKLKRILVPFYVAVAVGAGILFLRNGLFPAFAATPAYSWIDALKLLFVPFLVYDYKAVQIFNGDFWFIPLIFQLYLVFPFLLWLMRKYGGWRALIGVLAVGFAARFAIGEFFSSAPMGVAYPTKYGYYGFGFFLPRAAEFFFGMFAAWWYRGARSGVERRDDAQREARRDAIMRWCSGVPAFVLSIALTAGGFMLNMYMWGWAFSDFVIGVGLFWMFLIVGSFLARLAPLQKLLNFMSTVSFEMYLLHHSLLNFILMPLLLTMGWLTEGGFWVFVPVFFVGTIIVGYGAYLIGQGIYRIGVRTPKPAAAT